MQAFEKVTARPHNATSRASAAPLDMSTESEQDQNQGSSGLEGLRHRKLQLEITRLHLRIFVLFLLVIATALRVFLYLQ
jgi:hypothetical protein